jgi:hypothetical protein
MKLSITPVAVAVALALGAAGANAQTDLAYGTSSPADGTANDGLYLAVWDNTSGYTDLVDLGAIYKNVSLTKTDAMITPTPGSNGWTTVSNFDGYASVDQIDLGTISNFSTLFPASSITSATNYVILAGNTSGQQMLASAALNNTNPDAVSAIAKYTQSAVSESATWTTASTSSPLSDTTGKAAYSALAGEGPIDGGTLSLSGANFAVNVGTAAGFYSYLSNQLAGTSSVTPYTYTDAQGNSLEGFWFLSDTGDLSWNLVASASNSTVPLPPAVWLFASGLIGLGLIGRRRNGLGAAV